MKGQRAQRLDSLSCHRCDRSHLNTIDCSYESGDVIGTGSFGSVCWSCLLNEPSTDAPTGLTALFAKSLGVQMELLVMFRSLTRSQ